MPTTSPSQWSEVYHRRDDSLRVIWDFERGIVLDFAHEGRPRVHLEGQEHCYSNAEVARRSENTLNQVGPD